MVCPDRRRKRPTFSQINLPNTPSRRGHPARHTHSAHARIVQSPDTIARSNTLVVCVRCRLVPTREIATPRTAPRSLAPDIYTDAPHAALQVERRCQYCSHGFSGRTDSAHVPWLRHLRLAASCTASTTSLMAHTAMHAGGRELSSLGMQQRVHVHVKKR